MLICPGSYFLAVVFIISIFGFITTIGWGLSSSGVLTFSSGTETTNFAPAFSTKTLYSVKNGAMAIHSSSLLVINALSVIDVNKLVVISYQIINNENYVKNYIKYIIILKIHIGCFVLKYC